MSSWSMNFKKKMMQLHRAFLDPDTGEIFRERYGEIHSDIMDRMNQKRLLENRKVLSVPEDICFDDWEYRGYVHKETGRFMSANEAAEWAEPSEGPECWWDGEGNQLKSIQKKLASEMA